MIDQFTKWAECVPIPSIAAKYVIPAFISQWICRFGIPNVLVNDNYRTLLGSLIQQIHTAFGTKNLVITPYHPEGNATIKSLHFNLSKGLQFFQSNGFSQISFDEALQLVDEALQLVLYFYRSILHLTLNDFPAFLLFGTDLRPQDNDWRFFRDIPNQERIKFLNNMPVCCCCCC